MTMFEDMAAGSNYRRAIQTLAVGHSILAIVYPFCPQFDGTAKFVVAQLPHNVLGAVMDVLDAKWPMPAATEAGWGAMVGGVAAGNMVHGATDGSMLFCEAASACFLVTNIMQVACAAFSFFLSAWFA
jgi:hypothetical protein